MNYINGINVYRPTQLYQIYIIGPFIITFISKPIIKLNEMGQEECPHVSYGHI
jgi:hypothetical protein